MNNTFHSLNILKLTINKSVMVHSSRHELKDIYFEHFSCLFHFSHSKIKHYSMSLVCINIIFLGMQEENIEKMNMKRDICLRLFKKELSKY